MSDNTQSKQTSNGVFAGALISVVVGVAVIFLTGTHGFQNQAVDIKGPVDLNLKTPVQVHVTEQPRNKELDAAMINSLNEMHKRSDGRLASPP